MGATGDRRLGVPQGRARRREGLVGSADPEQRARPKHTGRTAADLGQRGERALGRAEGQLESSQGDGRVIGGVGRVAGADDVARPMMIATREVHIRAGEGQHLAPALTGRRLSSRVEQGQRRQRAVEGEGRLDDGQRRARLAREREVAGGGEAREALRDSGVQRAPLDLGERAQGAVAGPREREHPAVLVAPQEAAARQLTDR